MTQEKNKFTNPIQNFLSILTSRERFNFWLLSGINTFFFLLMITIGGAHFTTCLAKPTIIYNWGEQQLKVMIYWN